MRNNVRLRPVLTRSIFDDSRVREEKPVGGNSSNASGHCLRCLRANYRRNQTNPSAITRWRVDSCVRLFLGGFKMYYRAVSDGGATSALVRLPSLIAVPSCDSRLAAASEPVAPRELMEG